MLDKMNKEIIDADELAVLVDKAALCDEMASWINKEMGWLAHIRPQLKMDGNIALGFDQAKMSGSELLLKHKEASNA